MENRIKLFKGFVMGLLFALVIVALINTAKAEFRIFDTDAIFSTIEKSHAGDYTFTIVKDVEADTQYIIVDNGEEFRVIQRLATNGALYVPKS